MDIVSIIMPFFALVLIGYLAARGRALPLEAVAGLNTYVLYFALSALLFQLGARTPVVELLDPVLMSVWLVAGLVVAAAALFTAVRGGRGWLDASLGGLIAVLPNSGFMGLPLIGALVGPDSGGPIITTLLVDIVIMQSLAIALSQRTAPGTHGLRTQVLTALSRVARNPMPWAIVLGAAWGATGLQLFSPLDDVLTMLAASATPVALFTIGAVLARQQMRAGAAGERPKSLAGDVAWLTALKLVVHPIVVWSVGLGVIAIGLPLAASTLVVIVLVAALPSATNASMLAERLGADNGRIASVILTSTALGFGSFTLAVTVLI